MTTIFFPVIVIVIGLSVNDPLSLNLFICHSQIRFLETTQDAVDVISQGIEPVKKMLGSLSHLEAWKVPFSPTTCINMIQCISS